MQVELLTHAAIKLTDKKAPRDKTVIYFDPYSISEEYHDADYIFITHDHYDHYDQKSIEKVSKEGTKLIVPECLKGINPYLVVKPNEEYKLEDGIEFQTIPAYNLGKNFHPKEKNYVGYNILIKGTRYYIMGDTDRTEEADQVKADVCFVPIGGEFTMDAREASDYINSIKPRIAIPIHYGKIAGKPDDEIEFKNRVYEGTEVYILMEDLSFYSDEELKTRANNLKKDIIINNGTNQRERKYLNWRHKLIISEQARRKLNEKLENGGSKK